VGSVGSLGSLVSRRSIKIIFYDYRRMWIVLLAPSQGQLIKPKQQVG